MTPPTEGFTLTPFWLGYAVALAVCVGCAWRLSREAKARDKATAERAAGAPYPRMYPCPHVFGRHTMDSGKVDVWCVICGKHEDAAITHREAEQRDAETTERERSHD